MRFKHADTERQWRDIGFCLSLLSFGTEKSLKKLADHFSLYQDKLYELAVGTAQKGINQDSFYSIEIPLPSFAEQQTLQSDFDEIRHKHVKIAEYRSKAQEALNRLIPGANRQEPTTKVSQGSVESHSSTCAVQADGTGCTCRNSLMEDPQEIKIITENTASLPSVYKSSKKNKIRITDDEI